METELIPYSLKKVLIQIGIKVFFIALIVYCVYTNVWGLSEYNLVLGGSVCFFLYQIFQDISSITQRDKNPAFRFDESGFTDNTSVYSKIGWSNIRDIYCVVHYPFFILYKEHQVIVVVKNKETALFHLKNEKVKDFARANDYITIQVLNVDLTAEELKQKMLTWQRRYRA